MLRRIGTKFAIGLLRFLAILPYGLVARFGDGLGWLLYQVPSRRRRIVHTNLSLCFPQWSDEKRAQIAQQHFRHAIRSYVERSVQWFGSQSKLEKLVQVDSAVDLTDPDLPPTLFLGLHFVGIEAGSIFLNHALGRRCGSLYQPMSNPELEAVYSTLTANVEKGLSTKLTQWSDDWTASFQKDGFATMACPGWMLGVVSGNAEGVEGWDFANVFPGGGGNWGGSFLTVPKQSEHPDEAKEFAAWITAPEQQVKAFQAIGAFPSQVDALDDPAVVDMTNEFFNNAPVGQILGDRAAAITVQPYKGPKYSDILQAFQAALVRVDDGSNTPEQSWETFLSDVEQL